MRRNFRCGQITRRIHIDERAEKRGDAASCAQRGAFTSMQPGVRNPRRETEEETCKTSVPS
jgi:hypothetical protein